MNCGFVSNSRKTENNGIQTASSMSLLIFKLVFCLFVKKYSRPAIFKPKCTKQMSKSLLAILFKGTVLDQGKPRVQLILANNLPENLICTTFFKPLSSLTSSC